MVKKSISQWKNGWFSQKILQSRGYVAKMWENTSKNRKKVDILVKILQTFELNVHFRSFSLFLELSSPKKRSFLVEFMTLSIIPTRSFHGTLGHNEFMINSIDFFRVGTLGHVSTLFAYPSSPIRRRDLAKSLVIYMLVSEVAVKRTRQPRKMTQSSVSQNTSSTRPPFFF